MTTSRRNPTIYFFFYLFIIIFVIESAMYILNSKPILYICLVYKFIITSMIPNTEKKRFICLFTEEKDSIYEKSCINTTVVEVQYELQT